MLYVMVCFFISFLLLPMLLDRSGQGTSGGGTSAGGTSGGGTSAGGSSGGGAGRQCVAAPPAGPSAAVPHPQTLPRLFRMLSVSSVGAVALGRLGGHRAVVKLLGTGPDGMGAFHAEVAAYSALQRQQVRCGSFVASTTVKGSKRSWDK